MGEMRPILQRPRTEAEMTRFAKAIQRADPTINRFRLTAEGDVVAERTNTPEAPPASYDALDFLKK